MDDPRQDTFDQAVARFIATRGARRRLEETLRDVASLEAHFRERLTEDNVRHYLYSLNRRLPTLAALAWRYVETQDALGWIALDLRATTTNGLVFVPEAGTWHRCLAPGHLRGRRRSKAVTAPSCHDDYRRELAPLLLLLDHAPDVLREARPGDPRGRVLRRYERD